VRAHFVLFVTDQGASSRFFRAALAQEPSLDAPGMTEFTLGENCVLGLMPASGIRRLLGRADVGSTGTSCAELYLYVPDPQSFHDRAVAAGAEPLSALQPRDWGDEAAYSRCPDGTLLAFARRLRPVAD
jgi:hypothetical protein